MTQPIASDASFRNALLFAGAGGLLSGILTPLLQQLIDNIGAPPGDFRIALTAVPFALLVLILVRRFSTNPWWAALIAVAVTVIAFVCAVNAAILIDAYLAAAAKPLRNILAGLSGGFIGAAIMAFGIGWLPAGPRKAGAWLPMLITGAVAGPLLALDNALDLEMISVLYPVWQAGVAVRLTMTLQRIAL